MTRYVAFLRGVNVGGHTLVKTADICEGLVARGFGNVRGYKQSGNIILDAETMEPGQIAGEIRGSIRELIGKDVEVFLRPLEYVRAMVGLDPFAGITGDLKLFVTFYPDILCPCVGLPLKSPDGDAEIIMVRGREAYGVGYPKDGRYGASYGKIELRLGAPSTTRNWNTIKGIAAFPDR